MNDARAPRGDRTTGWSQDPHAGDGADHDRRGVRADRALVDRGLAPSRTKAQALIREGRVMLGGRRVGKPSTSVTAADTLSVRSGDDYVSRGAYKLLGAFAAFEDCGLRSGEGLTCLDIGASAGGFCDVLLRHGARRVIALDVGHGQLDGRIANDPRIIEMSGVNIREVDAAMLPFLPEMVVSDVSFISLTYVIPVISRIARDGADVVLLVKPQFEVGKGHLGKHGIVVDPASRQGALDRVVACARDHDLDVLGTAPSPIEGTMGNVEYLLYARRRGRDSSDHSFDMRDTEADEAMWQSSR
ncbi:TlyA family RNA methyltransferase [Bifidobacterium mongoliense]|uniref:TlyA family RNA methyltransferase n=1 Tax=Bifidobacterium mongoliense TaxID=518643 RepID=UPI0026499432|nr:TlyA family RNA methyltransferase [Bifidobacterium mongoliense]MDN5633544.1 TlyA family RNA methyltransferase [Bifidobacterium mongoliense]MDN6802568.1 TlyA family RNA methyltransferase [Bifidobacterium mongoliense]